ncbi:MAG: ribonuclease D [Gammaproteobacteria bacterium]|nr:ribonuclease D [Gammaproteobacteria bacterium]
MRENRYSIGPFRPAPSLNSNALLLTDSDALARHASRWARQPWLTVDTEFVREDTYHARLCLVQVGDAESCAVVDVLAIADLSPLWDALHAPGVLKVLHAAGQDLEIFVQATARCPVPLFDTQVAAALLGYGEQLGYAALVERLLGVKVDKSLARTDWSRRPLPAAALDYAAADVHHLAEIYPRLRAELEAKGRLGWLEDDCARMADPARYRTAPDEAWQRVKGLARLRPAEQGTAARLAAWREEQALARNRPRRWILDDEGLCLIAQRQPRSAADVQALPGLPPKFVQKHAEALVELLNRPPIEGPGLTLPEPLEGAQKALLKRLQETLRAIGERERVVPSLIANRDDLERLVRQGAQARIELLGGWRRVLAGDALLALREAATAP